jgi:hypothetical protein
LAADKHTSFPPGANPMHLIRDIVLGLALVGVLAITLSFIVHP